MSFAAAALVQAAEVAQTNAAQRWVPLAELLKKWGVEPLERVKQSAEGGDLTAQHYLGYCFAEGLRGNKDAASAVAWYERAGNAGYLPSLSNLGLLYERGELVTQDLGKAHHYYRLAADAGLAQAQVNLGFLNRDGLGVPRDYSQAMDWFQRAAKQGHTVAMIQIGNLHRFGLGVTKSLDEAIVWFQKAADKDPRAYFNLGLLYAEDGRSRADQEKAVQWYQRAAERGLTDAMFKLYSAYRDGNGVSRDWSEAKRWLEKAAEAGHAWAQCELGYYYEKGRYLTYIPNRRELQPDIPEAVRWYRRSASQNWPGGQYNLGLCFLTGGAVELDEEQGLELIRKAADQHHLYSMYELADLYAAGIGEPRNAQERPQQLLEYVARKGDASTPGVCEQAYRDIVFRCQYGLGTERDVVAAAEWYCRATLAGLWAYSLQDKLEVPVPDLRREPINIISRPVVWSSRESQPFLQALSLYLKAANLNDPAAMTQIGDRYRVGQEVPRHPGKAWVWLTLAAQNGSADRREIVAKLEKDFAPDELQESRRLLADVRQELKKVSERVAQEAAANRSQTTPGVPR